MSSAAAGSVMVSASSDSTTPGDTVVTRMTGSLSSRRPSVIAHAANLVPQYTAAVGLTSCAPIDATVTRCPAPWRRKCGRTAWIPCRRPRMLTSIIRSHSSAGRGLPPCTPRSGDAGAGRPADDDPTTRHRAASRGGRHPGRAQRGLLRPARAGTRTAPLHPGPGRDRRRSAVGRRRAPAPVPSRRIHPRAATAARPERVDPDLLQLMSGWPDNLVLLLGRTYDVLARNALGAALWRPFTHSDNLLLNIFLAGAAPSFYANWRQAAVNTVAGFRAAAGIAGDDPRVAEIVEELRAASQEFVEIWERNNARGKAADVKTFRHPEVGELTLRMQTFDVRSAPGQQLIVYHAEPGTASAQALALLGTLSATEHLPDRGEELPASHTSRRPPVYPQRGCNGA